MTTHTRARAHADLATSSSSAAMMGARVEDIVGELRKKPTRPTHAHIQKKPTTLPPDSRAFRASVLQHFKHYVDVVDDNGTRLGSSARHDRPRHGWEFTTSGSTLHTAAAVKCMCRLSHRCVVGRGDGSGRAVEVRLFAHEASDGGAHTHTGAALAALQGRRQC